MDLTGKRVLITGSTSGIGLAAADMFRASGAHVAIQRTHRRRRFTSDAGNRQGASGRDSGRRSTVQAVNRWSKPPLRRCAASTAW